MKAVLGPYPPPSGGVALCAKEEHDKNGGIFIGTSSDPFEKGSMHLVRKRRFWNDLFQLKRIIKEHRNEISKISSHFATTFGFIAYLAKKQYGIPYTVTCHGSDIFLNLHRFPHSWLTRKALENASEIIVVSDALKQEIENAGMRNKIVVKRNSIDRKRFKKTHVKKKDQVIFVGAIAKVKGIDVLLRAFARAPKKYNLAIVGPIAEKCYYKKLQDIVKENGLQERVEFLGDRTDVPRLLNESRLFVLPSRVEGYGRALEEALACGVSCIASNVGGIPEAVKGKDCELVEPDDVEELVRVIEKALK